MSDDEVVDEGVESLREYMARREQIREAVTQQHDAMTTGERRRKLLLEYHCSARQPCLLLRIFATPYGPAFYRPAYVLTPERNLARSNESGRAANTSDGFNHWVSGCDIWMDAHGLEDTFGWFLNCRHVDLGVRVADIDTDLALASPGKPRRRRINRVSKSGQHSLVLLDSVSQLV